MKSSWVTPACTMRRGTYSQPSAFCSFRSSSDLRRGKKYFPTAHMARLRRTLRARASLLLGVLLRVNAGWLHLHEAEHADSIGKPAALTGAQEGCCPPCEDLFTKLERSANGTQRQETHLQLRGYVLLIVCSQDAGFSDPPPACNAGGPLYFSFFNESANEKLALGL